jgi:hypothetical protein
VRLNDDDDADDDDDDDEFDLLDEIANGRVPLPFDRAPLAANLPLRDLIMSCCSFKATDRTTFELVDAQLVTILDAMTHSFGERVLQESRTLVPPRAPALVALAEAHHDSPLRAMLLDADESRRRARASPPSTSLPLPQRRTNLVLASALQARRDYLVEMAASIETVSELGDPWWL